ERDLGRGRFRFGGRTAALREDGTRAQQRDDGDGAETSHSCLLLARSLSDCRREGLQNCRPAVPTSCNCHRQHDTHLWLFFAPSFSRRASASGHGWMRCTGPLAMSAVVRPSRVTALTSAPLETRY